jgi:hypothetical protein
MNPPPRTRGSPLRLEFVSFPAAGVLDESFEC